MMWMSCCKLVLPNFLLVGAAKSGTTALYYHLKGHPDIFLSPIKEPRFFSAQTLHLPQKGIGDEKIPFVRTFTDYCKLFEDARGKKAVGEASADTLYYYEKTIPVIKKYLEEPRIIILLRNPVERAFSSYLHLIRDNREYLSFEDGLEQEEERIRQDWQCIWHYKNRGMYYRQVKVFMEAFRRVKVILYDDFKKDPLTTIKQVCEFLEVNTDYQPADTSTHYNATGIPRFKTLNNIFLMKNILQRSIRNVGRFILTEDGWVKLRENLRAKLYVKTSMKPKTRAYLQGVFREDILKLRDLLDRDLSAWLMVKN
jgi:hypothetical protein